MPQTTAETITDDQIRAILQEAPSGSLMHTVCTVALGRAEYSTRVDLAVNGTDKYQGPWVFGHHLDGAGPARYGWGRRKAAGGAEYIGRDLVSIARAECARFLAYYERRAAEDARRATPPELSAEELAEQLLREGAECGTVY